MNTKKGQLKKAFNAPRLHVPHIDEIFSYTHPISGAKLLMGHMHKPVTTANGTTYDAPFVVAWVPPGRVNITQFSLYKHASVALKGYTRLRSHAHGPGPHSAFARDFQCATVYAWEARILDRGTPQLDDEAIENMIWRVADDFNMAAPAVKVDINPKLKHPSSFYVPDKHRIRMRDRGLSHVLHEVAHAIDMTINDNQWSAHGPSFVRTLLVLAERYQGFDQAMLEKSARRAGIQIADLSDLKNLKPRAA